MFRAGVAALTLSMYLLFSRNPQAAFLWAVGSRALDSGRSRRPNDKDPPVNLVLEHFGLLVFCFVLLVGSMIALPQTTSLPATSPNEMVGLGLAFVVIGGGFTWYYLARSHRGRTTDMYQHRTKVMA